MLIQRASYIWLLAAENIGWICTWIGSQQFKINMKKERKWWARTKASDPTCFQQARALKCYHPVESVLCGACHCAVTGAVCSSTSWFATFKGFMSCPFPFLSPSFIYVCPEVMPIVIDLINVEFCFCFVCLCAGVLPRVEPALLAILQPSISE